MNTAAGSDETAARTRDFVSETIPETDEERVAVKDTEDAEDQSWRHSLSQLPPFAFYNSSCFGPHFHREWKPKCNHYTMTRLYHPKDRCGNCGQLGGSGWLYRCTVDREALIIQSKETGLPYCFDDLGRSFAETMTLGKRGPQARTDKLSFLKELTKEELATYTPEQLVTISQQRDDVAAKIEESRMLGKEKYPYRDKPWMPSREHECQYKVCHACHHFGTEKSFVSLDAIVNDEVPPTVATAYGFSLLGFRQMSHASIVKNAGYRAVPLPRFHPARNDIAPNSVQGRLRRIQAEREAAGEVDEWATHSENFPPRGSLRRSSHFPDLRYSYPITADPSIRNAVNCITGSIRSRQLPVLPVFKKQISSDNDDDTAAILAAESQHLEPSSKKPIVMNVKVFTGDDTPPRQTENKTNAGITTGWNGIDDSSSSQSSPVVEEAPGPVNSTSLADICEDSEGSSDTWETLSAKGGVALTEEAAELGTPDIVAL